SPASTRTSGPVRRPLEPRRPQSGPFTLLGFARRLWSAIGAGISRVLFGRDVTAELRAERQRLSAELSRRLAELYALQELAQVLSASLRFDHVVAELARYAMRATDASGALVLLAPEQGGAFEVVAAKGFLADQLHRKVDPESHGVVLDAIRHERLELRAGAPGQLQLFEGARGRTAIAAPLRAHGVTVGALAVADKLLGDFTPEDARLLSTAATHAAVVLANARFFELVRAGKEQWESTFDALDVGIAIVDNAGIVRRANDALGVLLAEPVQRVIGLDLGLALFGDSDSLAGPLAAARAGRRAPAVLRRSARGRTVRVVASPLPTPVAEANAVVIAEDVTEQKLLEGQLMQSEKLAAIGTLVSGVAHELNNPLTSIAGLSELLLSNPSVPAAPEHLKVINDQAERASRIVRNLLTFARRSPGEADSLDLSEVVQRTVSLMSYELRQAGIELRLDAPAGLAPIRGNRDELQQVVLNLVANAAYAMKQLPEGRPRKLNVSVAEEDRRVVLRVSDTGPGMSKEVAAQIFDPFFTTKPPGEGTGLGLFLSYGIAESHGGTLSVESTPGEGATFTLSLPTTTRGAEAAAARPAAASARRILVVDDDAAVQRLVSVLFTHEGHTVDAVASGEEGSKLIEANDYDLVIADHRAVVGREPFRTALARLRPEWNSRLIITSDGGIVPQGVRVLSKPLQVRDVRIAATEVWSSSARSS
ncbi:MAG TPA: ATP-binding protein, partial [Gemmatimonadales bacterium]|nr:ATP-binding protein [Gemmatimonadales bacterium]